GESFLANIQALRILPPTTVRRAVALPAQAEPGKLFLTITYPERVQVTLARVDQEFFSSLDHLLGGNYFASFSPLDYVTAPGPSIPPATLSRLAADLVPVQEHNPVIIFTLRRGVRFHDGVEFTAQDVQFTYEAIMDPRNLSPRRPDYEPVKAVEILDPYRVKITYKRLYSPAFGTWMMGIIPYHRLNREALRREAEARGKDPAHFTLRDSTFNRHPIGTGPFKFVEWKSDEYIHLVRNEDYWEGPPHYKEFFYRIIPDLLSQEMAFYAGSVDAYSAQAHQVARLSQDPRYQHFSGLSYGYTYIGYNMRRELFRDKRVRKALGMAINVEEIIRYLLYNQAERITGPFPKQTEYYNPDVPPLPYDPEGALRLLGEAGWKRNQEGWLEKDGKPFKFTIITNNGNEIRKAIMVIAQNAWRRLGIQVEADSVEWTVFLSKYINKANFDAVILGWSMGIDPDLYQIWHSSQTDPGELNFVGYQNPVADDLIIKIRQEYDRKKQIAYTRKLHEIIYEDQPYTFLYVRKWTALLDRKIVIKRVAPDGSVTYEPIRPTKTGNYRFYFNQWIKLDHVPQFTP
ncbi:MAG: peptide ABC transporter substrate-binding protein, partial [Nitrospinota bacterium]